MQDKKKIVIGALCALVMIMAVGYALLSQQLQITGQANITSNWQVEITDIKEVENIGSGRTISTNYTATTATFNNEVIHTGDKITYEITVTNKGTLDAVLENYTIDNGDNDAIIVTTDKEQKFYKALKIAKDGGINKIRVSVQYNPNTTTQPSNSTNIVSVTLNYEQDLGQVEGNQAYSIGDKITFANSDWYVIKNSPAYEDYITLIKETVLTAEELGEYSYNGTNTMNFSNDSGDYSTSKIRELLEGTYLNNLESLSMNNKDEYEAKLMENEIDSNKLKDINGYKIRLITFDELTNNLGYAYSSSATQYVTNFDNASSWIYGSIIGNYWTMTPNRNDTRYLWAVLQYGTLYSGAHYLSNYFCVRPVINLYKSAIEK